jgi:hypothetical protein
MSLIGVMIGFVVRDAPIIVDRDVPLCSCGRAA